MPWFCVQCARRFTGPICKCGSQEAERIPPLDGMVELTEPRYTEETGDEALQRREDALLAKRQEKLDRAEEKDRKMVSELEIASRKLAVAKRPEDVFGALPGPVDAQLNTARHIYRELSKATHPDKFLPEHRAAATSAFKALQRMWETAQARIKMGRYGTDLIEPVEMLSEHGMWTLFRELEDYPVTRRYIARGPAPDFSEDLVKIARKPAYNHMVKHEQEVLAQLNDTAKWREEFGNYVPTLLNNFIFRFPHEDPKEVTVLDYLPGFYSLEDVHREYPDGIEARDMAWMFRRLLVAIGFAHENKIMNGAILPHTVRIHPIVRGLELSDWTLSKTIGEPREWFSTRYHEWGPTPRVKTALPSVDIKSAAQCMVYLLGDNPTNPFRVVNVVPPSIQAFLRGVINYPTNDAWDLEREFDEILEKLWGKRTYRPFIMNGRKENSV